MQTAGCAPLERAWKSAQDVADCASEWATHMWPWEEPPASLADGILDDETYDWVADTRQLRRTNGRVVVACEEDVVRAASIGPNLTAIQSSATGTAGLAGLLSERARRVTVTGWRSCFLESAVIDFDVTFRLSPPRQTERPRASLAI